ncbi:hypothetical protein HUX88_03155 [Duganella sp. BJB1802]|uniref:hypothetical protein n=1 Tax=Duganella sp. BJB1802 TaxID=2744575 RepID=UPI001593A41E|nr:hypothetical protein [Duganella sp. BJB1802]NVD69555.1 hypothetical protein [Duganella sp. BJB1802]
MSRLLPESIRIGLFPGGCWMKRGRGAPIVAPQADGACDADALLAALAALLAGVPKSGVGKMRLHVVVSDTLAAIAVLPWQAALAGEEELMAYGQACFERDGRLIDDGWVMRVGFRRFNAAGMAYALPRRWMEKLQVVCRDAGARLVTVLPVSAAAYWRHRPTRPAGSGLVLLEEASRLTALVYAGGSLIARDVQSVTGDTAVAGLRLLKRVSAGHGAAEAVQCWPAVSPESAAGWVHDCLPDARITPMLADVWS